MLKRHLAAAVLLAALPMAACGDKDDVNETNFHNAMEAYFAKKGDQCLGFENWPVDVKGGGFGESNSLKMVALQSVGLVRSEPGDADFTVDRAKAPVTRYSLTKEAEPFMHEREIIGTSGKVKATDLCWGKMDLHEIVKWEGPTKFGDDEQAMVTYTYTISDVADWAKGSVIQSAFPEVKRALDGVGVKKMDHSVKLTSEGWEARGLD